MAPAALKDGGIKLGGNCGMGDIPGFIKGIPIGCAPGIKLMGIAWPLNIGPGAPNPNVLGAGCCCCCAEGLMWLGSKI